MKGCHRDVRGYGQKCFGFAGMLFWNLKVHKRNIFKKCARTVYLQLLKPWSKSSEHFTYDFQQASICLKHIQKIFFSKVLVNPFLSVLIILLEFSMVLRNESSANVRSKYLMFMKVRCILRVKVLFYRNKWRRKFNIFYVLLLYVYRCSWKRVHCLEKQLLKSIWCAKALFKTKFKNNTRLKKMILT